ncbi:MAG TPA: NIPSNAP family protein [Ignavibacteria bacterium]
MIIVRNTFRLKFGKAKDAQALVKEAIAINKKLGIPNARAMMDLTGESYTLVFETGHQSLSDFEKNLKTVFASEEWAAMYQKMIPLVDSAHRDIFTVVE